MDRETYRNIEPRTRMSRGLATAVSTRTQTQREAFSRVPCRFFNSSKGCYNGTECRFSHDIASQDMLSSTSTNRADQLSSPRLETAPSSTEPRTVSTHVCGICFETPKKCGLLANCSHVFCLYCIRKWRSREGKSEETLQREMHKKCPICRIQSDLMIPSNTFYEHSTPQKQAETQKYLSRLSKIPCRYFTQSPTSARFCPFGNDCHYNHNVNGRRHVFTSEELARRIAHREHRAIIRDLEARLGELMTHITNLRMNESEGLD